MVEGIVKKIMFTGIDNYSKTYQASEYDVQIKVINDDNGSVVYKMCKNFTEVEEVRFLQIMNKKIDILGYEGLANPFLKKSIADCAEENGLNINQVCCFILKYKNNKGNNEIGLAFYTTDDNMKKIKIVSLSKHLEKLGI